MAHSRGSRQVLTTGIRSRRQTGWGLGPGASTPATLSATGSVFIGSLSVPSVEGLTVVRLRGVFSCFLSTVTSALDGFAGAVAVGVAEDRALGIGITAVPLPLTNADQENWLWHSFFSVKSTTTIGDTRYGSTFINNMVIDSKAMRKLPIGRSMYAILEAAEVGTSVLQVHLDTRALVKLP